MAATIEEAFAALESLDDDGRIALTLIASMLQEHLTEARTTAELAQWLLRRMSEAAEEQGLLFDLHEAFREWEAERGPLRAAPVSWFDEHVMAARRQADSELLAELHAAKAERDALRDELDDVLDSREAAEIRAYEAEDKLKAVMRERRGEAA